MMQIPQQVPEAPSTWMHYPKENICIWTPQIGAAMGTPENLQNLRTQGFEPIDTQAPTLMSAIIGQMGEALPVIIPGKAQREVWARSEDIKHATDTPVTLSFILPPGFERILPAMPKAPAPMADVSLIPISHVLPSPFFGEVGLVAAMEETNEPGYWKIYHISQLPPEATALRERMRVAIMELADPAEWYIFDEMLARCMQGQAGKLKTEWRSLLLSTSIQATRDRAKDALAAIDERQKQADLINESIKRAAKEGTTWVAKHQEVRRMAHELAAMYWANHLALIATNTTQGKRIAPLAALTSDHFTRLPSHNALRGLMQSFGGAPIQPSLWNNPDMPYEMITPNRTLIRVESDHKSERRALYQYLMRECGVEGLKYMVIALDIYNMQTGGAHQKLDARVSPRQIALRLYNENKAGDPETIKKVLNTILYMARSTLTSDETYYDPKSKRKRRQRKEASPLLVIERWSWNEEDDSLKIPDEVVFHLGADHYDLLYGDHQQFFIMPTAQILQYHSTRQEQEILAAFYLSNHLIISGGMHRVTFPALMVQSAIMTEEQIKSGTNRTRDALRALYALEQLERDGWIRRDAHTLIDEIFACDLALQESKPDDLSEGTRQRVTDKSSLHMAGIAKLPPDELKRRRRKALQRLMDATDDVPSIIFHTGHLLAEQANKRKQQQEAARQRADVMRFVQEIRAAEQKMEERQEELRIAARKTRAQKRLKSR